jgi:hypothetical protein
LVALVALTITWVVSGVVHANRRIGAVSLQELARQLGLEFLPADHWRSAMLTGTRRGKAMEVSEHHTSLDRYVMTSSVMAVRPAPGGEMMFQLQFRLHQRSFLSGLGEKLGCKRLMTGDAVFDAVWIAWSNQPDYFRAALGPELRAKLMAARALGVLGTFEMLGGVMRYAEVGSLANTARCTRFAALADLVCDLAEVAENTPPHFSRQPPASQIPP